MRGRGELLDDVSRELGAARGEAILPVTVFAPPFAVETAWAYGN